MPKAAKLKAPPAPSPGPTRAPAQWIRLLTRFGPTLAILLLAAIAHFPGLNGVYIWDDSPWLFDNPVIQDLRRLPEIWFDPWANPHYYPMVFTTFSIEWALWGNGTTDPQGVVHGVGYHVDNLILHVIAAVTLFQLFKRLKLPGGAPVAWFAAAVWAVHPTSVESIAWVAERKNVLCAAFLFPAFLLAFKVFGVIENDAPALSRSQPKFPTRTYVLALLLFLLAMLSKTTACFLPPAILIAVWWRRGKITARETLLSLPFFAIALAMGAVTSYLEHAHAGARGAVFAFSPLQRLLIAGNAYWFYLGKLLWPYPVIQIYPRFPIDAGEPIRHAWLFIGPAALLLLIAALATFHRRLPRGPLAFLLIFGAALFPALGFISFYTMQWTFVADHYQYFALPVAVLFVVQVVSQAACALAARLPNPAEAARATGRLLALSGAGVLGAMMLISFGISSLYVSESLLWGFAAKYNSQSAFVLSQYASALLREGSKDFDFMVQILKHGTAIDNKDWRCYAVLNDIYSTVGNYEAAASALHDLQIRMSPEEMAERDKALSRARRHALANIHRTPQFLKALDAEENERWDDAIALYKAALQAHPDDDEARLKIGFCLQLGKKDLPAAEQIYREVLTRRPDHPDAWLYWGIALRELGREDDAKRALLKAHELGGSAVLARHPEFLAPKK